MGSTEIERRSGGFTLIESLVAIMVISAVLAVLGPVLFHVANQRARDEGTIERDAILRSESNRLSTLAFSALDAEAGCASVTSREKFPYSRCITVTAVSSRERTVRVAVDPANPMVPADSVVFTRVRMSSGNPFNTTSP
jgi:prepilin-type N-terminal cleavage/methylation domain-containing protein